MKIMFEPYAYIRAKQGFSFRVPGQRGKAITVKQGDIFWIVSPSYVIKRDENIEIARKGKSMGYAYLFPKASILEFFEKDA